MHEEQSRTPWAQQQARLAKRKERLALAATALAQATQQMLSEKGLSASVALWAFSEGLWHGPLPHEDLALMPLTAGQNLGFALGISFAPKPGGAQGETMLVPVAVRLHETHVEYCRWDREQRSPIGGWSSDDAYAVEAVCGVIDAASEKRVHRGGRAASRHHGADFA